MILRKQIKRYYANHFRAESKIGAEVEFFLIDIKRKSRLYYSIDQEFFLSLATFLEKNGFINNSAANSLTFHHSRLGTISLEPGSQLEFSTLPHHDFFLLKQNIDAFYQLIAKFRSIKGRHIVLLPKGFLKNDTVDEELPMLKSDRYLAMYKYFQRFGNFGEEMMKCTCALQLHFDYNSFEDMRRKVNRLLMSKPILLYLSSNSIDYQRGYYSYRDIIWEKGDPTRTGAPGTKAIWQDNTWSLDAYLDKILTSANIFSQEGKHELVQESLSKPSANMAEYEYLLSTIFTDIRVRKTIELRYLDSPNPTILFPLIFLTHKIIYDDSFWATFEKILPYRFWEIKRITNLINQGQPEGEKLWREHIMVPLVSLLKECKTEREFFDPLISKIYKYKSFQKGI